MLKWPFDMILPIVYNDALTMQENLQILFNKTNEVIENADSVQDLVYKILQAYVTDYTTTLSYDKENETINFDLTLAILEQPQNITVTEEATEVKPFAYIAGATGYRWEYSTDNGKNWFTSTEDGSSTYQMSTLALSDRNSWLWRLFAWNDTRSIYTNAISIKVDVNSDGDKPVDPTPEPEKLTITDASFVSNTDRLGDYLVDGDAIKFKVSTTLATHGCIQYNDNNSEWFDSMTYDLGPNSGYFEDDWTAYFWYTNFRQWRAKAWDDNGNEVYKDIILPEIKKSDDQLGSCD